MRTTKLPEDILETVDKMISEREKYYRAERESVKALRKLETLVDREASRRVAETK